MLEDRAARVEGAAAARQIEAALEQVAAALPYLRASVRAPLVLSAGGRPPADGAFMGCDELIADRSWLETVVRASGDRLGTSSPAVAGSLFLLGYAYRILTLALSCLVTSAVVPGSTAGAMAIGLRSGRPSLVDYRAPSALVILSDDPASAARLAGQRVIDSCLGFVLDSAVEGHLRALVDSVHSRVSLGKKLLWGNVATGAATAFRTMEGLHGPWVRDLAARFFELAPQEIQGQGSFFALEHAGRRGWYWERANCCLNDRLPEKIRCSDCSKTPPGERRSAYLAALSAVTGG